MPLSSRDQPFRTFVAAHRPRLLACAWLLAGDPVRAEQLTEATLASLYEAWPRTIDPVHAAYQTLVRGGPSGSMPWRPEERVQLVDAASAAGSPVALVRDLGDLASVQRHVFVLERVAGFPPGQVGALLAVAPSQVPALALAGWAALVERDPRRADDARFAAELHSALAGLPTSVAHAATDVEHGRTLVRRRRVRALLVAAAALILVALVGSQLTGAREPRVSQARVVAPTMAPLPSFSPPPQGRPVECDAGKPACRAKVLRDWRARVAAVAGTYLDPTNSYFNGYSYAYTELYETPGFWSGQPGALGVDMLRDRRGSTQVYVQIATSRQTAVKCGTLTRQRCVVIRFIDGNRFLLTETSRPAEGIEVQYRPTGDQVITVVVREMAGGPPLAISRGDLVELVQDDRLRLPRL